MTSYHAAYQMDGWRGDGGMAPSGPLNLPLYTMEALRCGKGV